MQESLHDQDADSSFIDLNRSGCALMEIVSEPDMRSQWRLRICQKTEKHSQIYWEL